LKSVTSTISVNTKPQRIYNVDETGFSLNNPNKVIAKKGKK